MRTSFLLLLVIAAVAVAAAVIQPVAIQWLNDMDDWRIQRLVEWAAEEEHDAKRAEDRHIYGGLRPISNIEDPRIQGLGEWAVAEHAKRANNGLKFLYRKNGLKFGKVVRGQQQVVAGMNYFLLIEALDGYGRNGTYNALVYEQYWTDTRELVAFIRAN